MDATAVAKLLEEVKVMFRDLPSRVESELGGRGTLRRGRRFHPMMLDEIVHLTLIEEADVSVPWLLIGSLLRDEIPRFSDAALEVYRALVAGDSARIEEARRNLFAVLRIMERSKMLVRRNAMMRRPSCLLGTCLSCLNAFHCRPR